MTATPPRVLTIAGSDSGGGAGIQADLRTLFACGVHGCVALTAVTVQNSLGVTGVSEIPAEVVAAQIISVAEDIGLQAAKTGMLASAAIIEAITPALDRVGIGRAAKTPFVVDPVSASMHGDQLLADSALDALRGLLFPRATLVTPNLDKVRLITGLAVKDRADQREAAIALHAMGPEWVLVKGGHMWDDPECVDLLYDGREFTEFAGTTQSRKDASIEAHRVPVGVEVPHHVGIRRPVFTEHIAVLPGAAREEIIAAPAFDPVVS